MKPHSCQSNLGGLDPEMSVREPSALVSLSLRELLVHAGLYPHRVAGESTPELREDSVCWSAPVKWIS